MTEAKQTAPRSTRRRPRLTIIESSCTAVMDVDRSPRRSHIEPLFEAKPTTFVWIQPMVAGAWG
jgi:hypothetical protein